MDTPVPAAATAALMISTIAAAPSAGMKNPLRQEGAGRRRKSPETLPSSRPPAPSAAQNVLLRDGNRGTMKRNPRNPFGEYLQIWRGGREEHTFIIPSPP